ncbi:hypothetical protein B0H11DRAFT_1882404 [Mycena galericulata]|nr:hypothetical protein B0H11DRAFT_1882404 [Mycena galericulata]
MAENLPDELLSEILTPALKVSDEMFSDTSRISPFSPNSTSGHSSSALLLVCKAWLRVSTPLLYNVVIVRSKAQAGALAAALRGKHDPGRFIKKLRVEGGFGAHMGHILKSTPNVTDIFLSAVIHSPDTTSGLVLGLSLLNPTRLILFEEQKNLLKNKSVVQLFQALVKALNNNWTNLTTVVLVHERFFRDVRKDFQNAILSSKTIEVVSLRPNASIDFMNQLVEIPSLNTIEIRSTPLQMGPPYMNSLTAQPRLTPFVKFSGPEIPVRAPVPEAVMMLPVSPTFQPMASSPASISERVWKRILYFAMIPNEVPPRSNRLVVEYLALADSHYDMKRNSRGLNFALVSKTFYRLALPYLYRYPAFWDPETVRRFAKCLNTTPSLGSHVRDIHIREPLLGFGGMQQIPDAIPIFSSTTRLARLISDSTRVSLPWEAFEILARTAGRTLVEMSRYSIDPGSASVPYSPAVFMDFTALRTLTWDSKWDSPVVFSKRTPSSSDSVPGPFFASLPALESLHVSSAGIFPALEQFELPRLDCLVLDEIIKDSDCKTFLTCHGQKLTEMKLTNWTMQTPSSIFELCPALLKLDLQLIGAYTDEVYPPQLVCPIKHQSLVQLMVRKDINRTQRKDKEEWSQFWGGSVWTNFPALREIKASPFEWPTNEHAISKSPWVKWAAELLAQNIQLVNNEGVHWRPRLQGSRR